MPDFNNKSLISELSMFSRSNLPNSKSCWEASGLMVIFMTFRLSPRSIVTISPLIGEPVKTFSPGLTITLGVKPTKSSGIMAYSRLSGVLDILGLGIPSNWISSPFFILTTWSILIFVENEFCRKITILFDSLIESLLHFFLRARTNWILSFLFCWNPCKWIK